MTQPDKAAMAAEIGKLEGELAELEAARAKADATFNGAKTNRTVGALGILVGLVLLLIFWPLGALLAAAGVLALITAISNQQGAEASKKKAEGDLKTTRARLAELRALLMAG